ncbi:alpha/beta hydrolase [Actinokineospora sp. NBRC 105648]|uniref:alpha/beta hydrolase family protein n=1 Tax=Actinokineospora sp. NBRC 105648 TaxID=3032206 RepID=UPI00249FEBB2|nr:alpha/beta hydrolase [Actinokineospora sp. NBRC 105648]GLZ37524.1 lipase [Actinokineospora sp. NBRC 105648]
MVKRALLAAVIATAALVTPAVAATPSTIAVPRPTGRYPVGASTLHLVDKARTDPWAGGPRELMITLRYPALPAGRPAPYATVPEVTALLADQGIPVDAALVAGTRTNARVDAPPLPGRRPLVILSPGFGLPRFTLTGLSEDLASHGYVVATVDHAYESVGMALPDGRLLGCEACEVVDGTNAHLVPETRAKDVTFLLDRLLTSRYARLIHPRQIGMAGHSIGGAAAVEAMRTDRRVRAGADFDGTIFTPATLDRPFLLVDSDRPADPSWTAAWPELTGPKGWRTVAHANHGSFHDVAALAPQLGFPDDPALPGARATEITRGLLLSFLDRYLKGVPVPEPHYPEVRDSAPNSADRAGLPPQG